MPIPLREFQLFWPLRSSESSAKAVPTEIDMHRARVLSPEDDSRALQSALNVDRWLLNHKTTGLLHHPSLAAERGFFLNVARAAR